MPMPLLTPREDAHDALESEARRRAVEGVPMPVYYNGKVCGTVRKYSDFLLMFLMKAKMPQYRDSWHMKPPEPHAQRWIRLSSPMNSGSSCGRSPKQWRDHQPRPGTPLSLEDPRRLVEGCPALQQRPPEQCDRLHHAEGYARRASVEDPAERDRKLDAARKQRQTRQQKAA